MRSSSKRPGGGELGAELLVAGVEVAGTGGRDRLDVELVDALRLVRAHAAVDDDLHAVPRRDRDPGKLLAEERRADLAARVLQDEEAVAGCRERGLADLALDPDVGEDRIGVEQAADATVEVGDAQDARRGSGGRCGLTGRRPHRLGRLVGLVVGLVPERERPIGHRRRPTGPG